MPNRKILELNDFFQNSYTYETHLSKRYLSKFSNNRMMMEDYEFIETKDINIYYKIKSLEVFADNENVEKIFKKATGNLISAVSNKSEALAMIFYSERKDDVSVYIGTNYLVADELLSNFKKGFNGCEAKTEWISKDRLESVQNFCGIINTSVNIDLGDINKVLRNAEGNFLVGFISIPCDKNEINNNLDTINTLIEKYQAINCRNNRIGFDRGRFYESEKPGIRSLINRLEKEKDRFEKGQDEGLFKTLIYVCAQDEKKYRSVSTSVLSVLNKGFNAQSSGTAAVCLEIGNKLVDKTLWKIPVSNWDVLSIQGLELFDSSFLNLYTAEEVASLILPPTESFSGYRISFFGKSRENHYFFDRTFEERNGENIIMGDVIDGSSNYPLGIDNFRTHTFVTGATQTGKTTTTRKIVYDMIRNDIPVIIIEPAKSDYWKLKKAFKTEKLKVYSFKNDANDLFFNPFQPEDGVLIDTHIQGLTQALISMFEEEDPLPQLIQKLVYYCYEQKGIDVNCRAKENDGYNYPTFNDMLNFIDSCINETYSDGEINNNMKDVLKIRLGSLVKGNVGKALNNQHHISIKDMFDSSAIVELDGLNTYTQAFLAAIITNRINEYVRRQGDSCGKIKRLLVLEEAHNLMPSLSKSSSKTQKMMSQYFVKMLAEISSTGTGVVIVDQRPSEVSDAALANTSIKICHALRERSDKTAVADSLSLSVEQAEKLSSLRIGEAIIKSAVHSDICVVRINGSLSYNPDATCACAFCEKQDFCSRSKGFISEFDQNYVKSYGADERVLNKVLSGIVDRNPHEDFSYSQRMCIAGKLLELAENNDIVNREVLYKFSEKIKMSDVNDR